MNFKFFEGGTIIIKLICSDLDGTLLDDAGNLQVGFYDTIKMLNEKGITFVPASGRLYGTLNHTFSNSDFPLLFIAHNGALVQYSNGGKEIYKNTIEPSQVKKAVKVLKQLNLQIYLCTKTFAYVENPSKIMLSSFEKGDMPAVLVDNLEDSFSDIYRIGVYDPNKIKKSTLHQVEEMLGDEFEYMLGGEIWLDIMNKGVNKGNAIKKIQEKFSISKIETMVFGDYYNDISMLNAATYSYAMGNAPDDVKKHAKFITKSNNNNSVIKTILANC